MHSGGSEQVSPVPGPVPVASVEAESKEEVGSASVMLLHLKHHKDSAFG